MNTKDYDLILNDDYDAVEINISAQDERISIAIEEYDRNSFSLKIDSVVKLRDYLNDYIEEHDA